jgi:hypothetical protein
MKKLLLILLCLPLLFGCGSEDTNNFLQLNNRYDQLNRLVDYLEEEERKKIELWAHATKHLVSLTGEGDYSLAIKVISENNNIPVILVNVYDSILESRNFQINTNEITPKFLRNKLNEIKKNGRDPIEINIIGEKQWIYFDDSYVLRNLRNEMRMEQKYILIEKRE